MKPVGAEAGKTPSLQHWLCFCSSPWEEFLPRSISFWEPWLYPPGCLSFFIVPPDIICKDAGGWDHSVSCTNSSRPVSHIYSIQMDSTYGSFQFSKCLHKGFCLLTDLFWLRLGIPLGKECITSFLPPKISRFAIYLHPVCFMGQWIHSRFSLKCGS